MRSIQGAGTPVPTHGRWLLLSVRCFQRQVSAFFGLAMEDSPEREYLLSDYLISRPLNNMPTTRAVKGKRKNKAEDRKKIASEFFGLLMQGKVKDGLRFFAPDCKQHNPYIS